MAHLPSADDIYDAYLENASTGGDESLFAHTSDRIRQQTSMRRMTSDPSRSPQARAITTARNTARRVKNHIEH